MLGLSVMVIGPAVEYTAPLAEILSSADTVSSAELADFAAKFLVQERFATGRRLQDALSGAGVVYVDQASLICSNKSCRVTTETGQPLAWDYGHYTLDGSIEVARLIVATGRLGAARAP
jgi:hypothetical protein